MSTTTSKTPLLDAYEAALTIVRTRSLQGRVGRLLAFNDLTLRYFILHYCGVGVHLTEPVESWIIRAGKACIEKGYADLGENLIKHAAHEADHHLMYIADVASLIKLWQLPHTPASFYEGEIPPAAKHYRDLHEEVIASAKPFGQIAIEYEIEQLSVDVGPPMIKSVHDRFGVEVVKSLSFVTSHISFDKGHTKLNRKELNKLLNKYPDSLDHLIKTGTAALDGWWGAFDACLDMAEKTVAALPVVVAPTPLGECTITVGVN